jgi:hypothetical protein
MGKLRQRLYWEWLQIRGNAKWQAIWSFIEPYWKLAMGAVASMLASAVAYFWNWTMGLPFPFLFVFFFALYVLGWGLVVLVVFIFRDGKQQPVEELLPLASSPPPKLSPPKDLTQSRREPQFEIEYIEQELLWRAAGETDFHPLLPDSPIAKDTILGLRVTAKITANPTQYVNDVQLEVEDNGPLYPYYPWKSQNISPPHGLQRDFYFDIHPPLERRPYLMNLFARRRVDEGPAGPNFTEHRSQSFDVHFRQAPNEIVHRKQQETLTRLFEKGTQVRDALCSLNPVSENIAKAWEAEVCSYLRQILDPVEFSELQNPTTNSIFSLSPDLFPLAMSEKNRAAYARLSKQLKQLDEIIKRLKD